MDPAALDAEQAEIEEDILKLQRHSIPLNLAWDPQDEEEEDEDEETALVSAHNGMNEPSTSGIVNNGALVSRSNSAEIPSEDDMEYSDEEEEIDLSKPLEPTAENMLKLNLAYQEVIQMQIYLVDELLKDNADKQSEIENADKDDSEQKNKSGRKQGVTFRINTFTHNPFHQLKSAALHADVERRMNEIGDIFLHIPFPSLQWKVLEDKTLREAVEHHRLRELTEPLLSQLEYLREKYAKKEEPEMLGKIRSVENKIEEYKRKKTSEIVGDRHLDHDWDAISNVHFEGVRTPTECMLRWRNHLHPSLNSSKWSKKEDDALKKIAAKHSQAGWNDIAAELNTGRTALECIQRFQRTNKNHKQQPWTPEEDDQLRALVDKTRVGNIIPFTHIAIILGNRTGSQVCHRWARCLNPAYKKSRWTPEEDIALLRAIVKHGLKWSIIRDSGMVPGRHDSQCRERWHDCLRNINRGPWTPKEDEMIVELVAEHGEGKWAMVSQALDRRTDNQVCHRWKYIQSCKHKGTEIVYRKKGPKTVLDGLTAVRQRLLEVIEEQERNKANGDEERFALKKLQSKITLPKNHSPEKKVPLPVQQVIKPCVYRRHKKWKWLQENFSERVASAKTAEEMFKIYKEVTEEVEKVKFNTKCIRTEELRDATMISNLCQTAICKRFHPCKCWARQEGTNIHQVRQKVLESQATLNAKKIFVHYVKSLNINPERTLQAIESSLPKDKEADEASTSGTTGEKKTSAGFVRNYFLEFSPPNHGTLHAYRRLIKDKERRVKNAKLMLKNHCDENETAESDKQEDPHPFRSLYNGRKYDSQALINNAKQMPEHKILNARFLSLFTWPTILSSLVPYHRTGKFGLLKAAVNIRSTKVRNSFQDDEDEEPPRKVRRT